MAKPIKGVLGRGLDALIPAAPIKEPEAQEAPRPAQEVNRDFFRCPIELISPSGEQPRQAIDEARLEELAESIKAQGVIQPLVVRKEGDRYSLIAGERRWRAAQKAGLLEVPVVVKETSRKEAFELALVENLQREDLNPIEEAEAYFRLVNEFGHSQETIANRVGKDRTSVTNALRLLDLPPSIRTHLIRGDLSAGHGRALLSIKEQELMEAAAKEAIEKSLSVRQVESLAKRLKETEEKEKITPVYRDSANIRALADELRQRFGTRVNIKDRGEKRGGSIEIAYSSYEELDRILALLREE